MPLLVDISYNIPLNPVDKWILSLPSMESLGGWGIVLFTLITIVCTILTAGIIGIEREIHGHAAGLRTHTIIALGASLIMTLSIFAFPGNSRDPARLAAQVVSGIGFIGAGTIMQNGTGIRGLTTSASLWLCGGLGLASGCGFVLEALIGALATLGVLFLMNRIEKKTSKKNPQITIILNSTTPALHVALETAEKYNITVKDITSSLLTYHQTDCLKMVITLGRVSELVLSTFVNELRSKVTPYDIRVTHIRKE